MLIDLKLQNGKLFKFRVIFLPPTVRFLKMSGTWAVMLAEVVVYESDLKYREFHVLWNSTRAIRFFCRMVWDGSF